MNVPLSRQQLRLLIASANCVEATDLGGYNDLAELRRYLQSYLDSTAPAAMIAEGERNLAGAFRREAPGTIDDARKAASAERALIDERRRRGDQPDGYRPAPENPAPVRLSAYSARQFWRGETVHHIDGREGVVVDAATALEAGDGNAPSLSYLWVDFHDARECVAIGYLQKIVQTRPPAMTGKDKNAQGIGSPDNSKGAQHEQQARQAGGIKPHPHD